MGLVAILPAVVTKDLPISPRFTPYELVSIVAIILLNFNFLVFSRPVALAVQLVTSSSSDTLGREFESR